MSTKPILVVIGSTATGKSKLAIELALRFNGEIISADSIQLYKGLDIVSNKVTKEEQKQIKHHFISTLEPTEVYTVTDFRAQVDKVIKELHNQNKLPIIVGGTYYYVESILYDKLIKTEDGDTLTLATDGLNRINYTDQDLDNLENFFKHEIRTFSFDNVDSNKLHKLLRQVDETTANKIHPNDKRKIVRALQVYQKTKQKYSDLIKEQHKDAGTSEISGKLRFPNSLILNLNANRDVLHDRIERRIDIMLKRGLIDELNSFYQLYHQIKQEERYSYLDKRKGIFQIIGFKEFNDYLNYVHKNKLYGKKITDESQIDNDEIKTKLINRGLDNLKVMTKKYSKTQIDWFNNRFLGNLKTRATPPIFNLDVNDLDRWDENVLEPAIELVNNILIKQSTEKLDERLERLRAVEYVKERNEKQLQYCKYCDKSIVDSKVWQLHLNSKNHKRNKKLYDDKLVNRINYVLVGKVGLAVLIAAIGIKVFIFKS